MRDLIITSCCFICFYELFHPKFVQYLNSFRFEEFPSVLRRIDYPIDNKQINFNCFFGILLTKSRVSLKFVTNKLIINCFCLNHFDEITSVNGIVLRGQCDILSIWYTLPYNSHSWQFLWSWELASLSPSAPGMFVFFLAHKNFFWLTVHSNFTNHKEETFSFRIL